MADFGVHNVTNFQNWEHLNCQASHYILILRLNKVSEPN